MFSNNLIRSHFRLAIKDVPITVVMGNQASTQGHNDGLPPRGHAGKVEAIGSLRKAWPVQTGAPRRPMPDDTELERRFNEVLMQMDLPPDRAKLLRSFDNAKKWDIICDREQVTMKKSLTTMMRSLLDVPYKCTPAKSRNVSECLITIFVAFMIIRWLSK